MGWMNGLDVCRAVRARQAAGRGGADNAPLRGLPDRFVRLFFPLLPRRPPRAPLRPGPPPPPPIVPQRAVPPRPRWALLLLCSAYVVPGFVGREPWKSADITAFGYMLALARGQT